MSRYSVTMNPSRILEKSKNKMRVELTKDNLSRFKTWDILHFKTYDRYARPNTYVPIGDWKLEKIYLSKVRMDPRGHIYTQCIIRKVEEI